MHKRGFTLIELVMIITILGILSIIAIPRFIDLRTKAEEKAQAGIVAAIESGAQLYKAQQLINGSTVYYPETWQECLDTDTTADIDSNYDITYDSTTGQVTAISRK